MRKNSEMLKQWEVFQVGPNTGETLHATLYRNGTIVIGSKAYQSLGKPKVVELLFDRVNSLIGIRPAYEAASNAYPMHKKPKGDTRYVAATKFCRHYGIRVERTIGFIDPEVDDEGTLVLDLRATRVISRG